MSLQVVSDIITHKFAKTYLCSIDNEELTIETAANNLIVLCQFLKTEPGICCEQLIDLAGVDYLHYGMDEWQTMQATSTGFSRASSKVDTSEIKQRFAVVYHLLSLSCNHRIRVRCLPTEKLQVPSVIDIWPAANWYEREAFDLFGILFNNHPDLRRLLTDYGFIGHPFRKDFPLTGHVEVRYDASCERVIYEPVDIELRTLVPKTIRK